MPFLDTQTPALAPDINLDRNSRRVTLEARPFSSSAAKGFFRMEGDFRNLGAFRESILRLAQADNSELSPPDLQNRSAAQRDNFGTSANTALIGKEVTNFTLFDENGNALELNRHPGRAVVLYFTGVGCPVARQSYSKLGELSREIAVDVPPEALVETLKKRGFAIWVVDSNFGTTGEELRAEMNRFGGGKLISALDETQSLASELGVQRTGTVVVISTPDNTVRYFGPVDDQLSEGGTRAAPQANFLKDAITALANDGDVKVPQARVRGCLINLVPANPNGEAVSYEQAAEIVNQKCATCHGPSGAGPFVFDGFNRLRQKARISSEAIRSGDMPPRGNDPKIGQFEGQDREMLSLDEKRVLLEYLRKVRPPVSGASDPLANIVPQKKEWPFGEPEYVLRLPTEQKIPAQGVLDYRHIKITAPWPQDVWVHAVAIRPGVPQVLHHIVVSADYKGLREDEKDYPEGKTIDVWGPGAPARKPLPGTAMFVPAGATLDLELHYTPNGEATVDQLTQVGIYCSTNPPARQLYNRVIVTYDLKIPPGRSGVTVTAERELKVDSILYALAPHMHLRGRAMTMEAIAPDGTLEKLLLVPRYSFNNQLMYYLRQPKQLQAGTKIRIHATFDNSDRNPTNPDPKATVGFGLQSSDEMPMGFALLSEPNFSGVGTNSPSGVAK